jgi:hypothetical protein
MNKLVPILALATSLAFGQYEELQSSLDTTTSHDYSDFYWEVFRYSDARITLTFDEAVTGTLSIAAAYPRNGTNYFRATNFTASASNTVFTSIVNKENFPAAKTYYTEILEQASATGPSRVLASGMWKFSYSVFEAGSISTNTGQNVIGPPYHTLTDVENWPFATSASAGDITSVEVSGGLLTGGGTNGAVTVTLSTNAVRAATSAAYEAAGAVTAHNTNAAAHAGLFDAAGSAAAVSNALAAGAAAGLTAVQVEADPTVAGAVSAHNTNAAAHSALFAAARTNATSINGVAVATVTAGAAAGAVALPLAGGTMTGALLTTRNFTATAPASDELPSASWVRSLAMRGEEWFLTSTVTNGYGEKTANFVTMGGANPTGIITNSIASPVASSTYLLGGVTTNTYGAIRSPVTVEVYMNRVGGNSSTVIPIHPEIYYVYDGTTNHLGDWETANQTITATTPTKYTFTVAFTEPTITGAVHLIAYLKSGTVSGSAAGLNVYGGGIYPSHVDIEGVAAGETAADVAADLAAHIADPTAAHAASAISATGTYANVQEAINNMGTGSLTASQATNIARTVAWTPGLTPFALTYAATVTVTRAMLATNSASLTLTGNTVLSLATNGWTTAEIARWSLDINRGTNTLAFDTAVYDNTTVLDVTAARVALFFRKGVGDTKHKVRQ